MVKNTRLYGPISGEAYVRHRTYLKALMAINTAIRRERENYIEKDA